MTLLKIVSVYKYVHRYSTDERKLLLAARDNKITRLQEVFKNHHKDFEDNILGLALFYASLLEDKAAFEFSLAHIGTDLEYMELSLGYAFYSCARDNKFSAFEYIYKTLRSSPKVLENSLRYAREDAEGRHREQYKYWIDRKTQDLERREKYSKVEITFLGHVEASDPKKVSGFLVTKHDKITDVAFGEALYVSARLRNEELYDAILSSFSDDKIFSAVSSISLATKIAEDYDGVGETSK
ncbi:MAG: hypothetical protein HRT90_11890 [Candidatus Margulisbacteria bacterium]|nr:hypothetical protein [Candidatus Margulisiibacteriota bacterium]